MPPHLLRTPYQRASHNRNPIRRVQTRVPTQAKTGSLPRSSAQSVFHPRHPQRSCRWHQRCFHLAEAVVAEEAVAARRSHHLRSPAQCHSRRLCALQVTPQQLVRNGGAQAGSGVQGQLSISIGSWYGNLQNLQVPVKGNRWEMFVTTRLRIQPGFRRENGFFCLLKT